MMKHEIKKINLLQRSFLPSHYSDIKTIPYVTGVNKKKKKCKTEPVAPPQDPSMKHYMEIANAHIDISTELTSVYDRLECTDGIQGVHKCQIRFRRR